VQLNFLQEDLLEILQQGKPAPAVTPIPNPTKTSRPEQMPLLGELPVPVKKSAEKMPTIETIIKEINEKSAEEKSPAAFKTISEAAEILGVPAYVLRFWESQFPQISPTKSRGGRRYYRPEDMEVLASVKHLLYKEGYTIKGARKAFSQLKHDVMAAHPVPVQKAASSKPLITPRQKSQLSAIRGELLVLREQLTPYLN